jgi:two-component system, OmpR family, alkaline phosphatase synthesis response regulator PhoP
MRKKILVVDDNAEYLDLLRMGLKRFGFSIASANNGIEALKKARSVSPHCIVLDLVLPELDGFAVCETLRKNPATAHIPVVMLTGLTSEFTRYAGMESGAAEYVTKPASLKQIVSKIRQVLRHPHDPSQAPAPTKPKALRAPIGVY